MAGMEQQLFPGDRVLNSGDETDLEEEPVMWQETAMIVVKIKMYI